jgi:hypothetical protein
MSPELKTVIEFCLEHAPEAPVRKRVLLYRGLAEFCGDQTMAAEFRSEAEQLAAAEKRCREFAFQISLKEGK